MYSLPKWTHTGDVMSFRLSSCLISETTERILIGLGIMGLHEKFSGEFNFASYPSSMNYT